MKSYKELSTPFGIEFIEKCRASSTDIKELQLILTNAISNPCAIHEAFEYIHQDKDLEDMKMKDVSIYYDDQITIARAKLPPQYTFIPHSHGSWALVGIYRGVEDNIFYQRCPENGLKETRTQKIETGEVLRLGPETIHNIANSQQEECFGIHIYGRDMVNNFENRSTWDPETFIEDQCSGPKGRYLDS